VAVWSTVTKQPSRSAEKHSPQAKRANRKAANAGVSVYIGHHPHPAVGAEQDADLEVAQTQRRAVQRQHDIEERIAQQRQRHHQRDGDDAPGAGRAGA
jgi:hypothetical protein